MRFSDLYTRENFGEVANLTWWRSSDLSTLKDPVIASSTHQAANEADTRDRKTLEEHKSAVFNPAMQAFLENLRDDGRLNALSGLGGREAFLPKAWNAFVNGTPDKHDLMTLLSVFEASLVHAIVMARPSRNLRNLDEAAIMATPALSEADIDSAYQKLVETVEQGDSHFHLRLDEIQDSKTGDRLKIEFKGWHATLLKRDGVNYTFQPAEDADEIPMQSVEIDLPTGELLISDWIRVPGFREATDLGYADESLNICCDQGAVNTTKAHAERHGFAHVQTTNTYVGVHQGPDGRLMVCENWDEREEDYATADGMLRIGAFSCDLWWVTAIDRQVLLELMAKGGCDAPEKALDDHLASKDAYAENITRLQVKPGRWRVHFGPDFAKRSDRSQMGIPEGPEPWLVLEPVED